MNGDEDTATLVPTVEPTPPPPAPLIDGVSTPEELVKKATAMADVLAKIVEGKRLYLQIGNKKHIYVEGWTTLGAMVSVFAHIEWTRPIDDGWEARCVVRTMAGVEVGAAEAQCSNDEKNWRGRDAFAIRSMAQTRATSKALRMPLGWIVQLGGYAPTPAEEIDSAAARPARRPAGIGAEENGAPMEDNQRKAIRAILAELFLKDEKAAFDFVHEYMPKAAEGTEIHLSGLTKADASQLIRACNDELDHRKGKGP